MPQQFEVHISDVRTYKSCRRRWNWSSPLRGHLEPRTTPIFFMVGKAVHYALASYYETGEHPADVFKAYMDKAALTEKLWDDELKKFNESVVLGVGMLENYRRWISSVEAPDERWEMVATEMPYGPMPIITPWGEPSENVLLAGRFDGIIRDKETGELWLREFKTSGREPNPQWLELDDQATIYCWAVQQIMGEPITGIQYRFLMKRFPDRPPRLKNGQLSKAVNSPQVMSTSYDLYMESLQILADEMVHDGRAPDAVVALNAIMPMYADVLDQLAEKGYSEYFQDIEVRKTQHELLQGANDLWLVSQEMINPDTSIYPAPDWLKCNFCPFKKPCTQQNAGGNFEVLLKHDYRQRVYEDVVAGEASEKVSWNG